MCPRVHAMFHSHAPSPHILPSPQPPCLRLTSRPRSSLPGPHETVSRSTSSPSSRSPPPCYLPSARSTSPQKSRSHALSSPLPFILHLRLANLPACAPQDKLALDW